MSNTTYVKITALKNCATMYLTCLLTVFQRNYGATNKQMEETSSILWISGLISYNMFTVNPMDLYLYYWISLYSELMLSLQMNLQCAVQKLILKITTQDSLCSKYQRLCQKYVFIDEDVQLLYFGVVNLKGPQLVRRGDWVKRFQLSLHFYTVMTMMVIMKKRMSNKIAEKRWWWKS